MPVGQDCSVEDAGRSATEEAIREPECERDGKTSKANDGVEEYDSGKTVTASSTKNVPAKENQKYERNRKSANERETEAKPTAKKRKTEAKPTALQGESRLVLNATKGVGGECKHVSG